MSNTMNIRLLVAKSLRPSRREKAIKEYERLESLRERKIEAAELEMRWFLQSQDTNWAKTLYAQLVDKGLVKDLN